MEIIRNENPLHNSARHESEQTLLTKAQLAERLNISVRTLEGWMQQRLIPYVKLSRTVRFIWADVEEALRRNFGVGYPVGTTFSGRG